MKRGNPFRKFRGMPDKVLGHVLDNHAGTLRGCVAAVSTLLRERRLLLLLHVAETSALVYLAWRVLWS